LTGLGFSPLFSPRLDNLGLKFSPINLVIEIGSDLFVAEYNSLKQAAVQIRYIRVGW
jgi:hypothetical protein